MRRYPVPVLRTAQFDRGVIEAHYAHLDALRARGALEMFGPFTDKSGGAYVVRADNLEQACAPVHVDQVHAPGSSLVSVREWNAMHVKSQP